MGMAQSFTTREIFIMKYLIKNFGLTALGLCLLTGAVTLEMRLERIETKLDKATEINRTLSQVELALNTTKLGVSK